MNKMKQDVLDFMKANDAEDDLHIMAYSGQCPKMEEVGTLGFVVTTNCGRGEIDKIERQTAFSILGVNEETVQYFINSSEAERENIRRLALIGHHKKELERLEGEIV